MSFEEACWRLQSRIMTPDWADDWPAIWLLDRLPLLGCEFRGLDFLAVAEALSGSSWAEVNAQIAKRIKVRRG